MTQSSAAGARAQHFRKLSQFYIGGSWVDPCGPSESHEVIDPATEAVSGTVAFGTKADIERAVAAAVQAFPDFAVTGREERFGLLTRLATIYERRLEEIAEAVTAEMGAPYHTLSLTAQAPMGLTHLRTTAACLRSYEFEKILGSTRLVREPVGVCGLITPWNWPMNQVMCKVAAALAVGCTMVLKPSQHSPYSAQILAEIVHEAGVPAGIFNLVFGDGSTLGEALAGHPQVAMISLTGSTSAGAQVARIAATTIKRVSLELGGKSANIILPDAPLPQAVSHGVQRMMRNSGQSCNAPSRMLVPRERVRDVEQLAIRACRELVTGDPHDPAVHIGPLANNRQYRKVNEMIAVGIKEGAKLLTGGPGRPPEFKCGYFVAPTVFTGVTNDMTIAREEIFGPVLAIMGYESEEEAIVMANDSIYGLSGYVYGSNVERARDVARRLRTGMVHLNGASTDIAAPFGGCKQSGNGREGGSFGLDEFSELKAMMGSEPAVH
jgi:acyl-CoA reductase-like NAD-dependent aldehyde dehydrogenase